MSTTPSILPPGLRSQGVQWLNEQALARQLADGAAAKALAEQALALAADAGDSVQQAFAHLNLSLQSLRNDSIERGTQHLEAARGLLAGMAAADPRVIQFLRHVEGMRFRRMGRRHEAIEAFKSLVGEERPVLDAYLTLSSLAVVLGMGADHYEALECFYEALSLARRSGELSLIVNALNNAGSFQLDLYNLDDAQPLLEECLAGAVAIGSRRQTIFAAGNLVQCLCSMGLAKEALQVAREHLLSKIQPDDIPTLQRDEEIATALIENGLLDEAEARLAGAQRTDEMAYEISTNRIWLRARLLLARGRPDEALALCLAHKETAEDKTAPPVDQVRLARIAAEAAAAVGDHGKAYVLLGEAYAIHEHLMGRAARAHFASLQIRHEVQRSTAERDAARRAARELEEANQSLREQIVENQRLQEQLRTEAIEDPLTGLHNRRYLFEAGSGLLSLAFRHGEPLAIALIDMDHFKLVNDRHGHETGDRVLCTFARLARRLMRASDVVCRYGGEEFVLVFALSDEASAQARLEAMQAEFRALRFAGSSGSVLSCTFSAGISSSLDGIDSLTQLLDHADKAMYAAKEAGRDCIRRWSELPEAPDPAL